MRLRIATPCDEDWTRMTPRPGGRHCAACDRVVVDLSALPPDQARRTLAALNARAAAGERVCARGRGEVVRPARGSARRRLTNALATLLAVAAAGSLATAEDSAPVAAPDAPTETPAGATGDAPTAIAPAPAGDTAPAEGTAAADPATPIADPQPEPDADAGPVIMGEMIAPVGVVPDPVDEDWH